MNIQCECGQFKAELKNFPKATPGRLACYCDDCQIYLHHLGRTDLLDTAGGTEIIPVYPSDFKIVAGKNLLKCTRLSPKGMFRWWASCCKTPIGNTTATMPWIGTIARVHNVRDPKHVERTFGPVRSSVMGKFARGTPIAGTSDTFRLRDFAMVMPFILKGVILGKKKGSPFFENGKPIFEPDVLSLEARNELKRRLNG